MLCAVPRASRVQIIDYQPAHVYLSRCADVAKSVRCGVTGGHMHVVDVTVCTGGYVSSYTACGRERVRGMACIAQAYSAVVCSRVDLVKTLKFKVRLTESKRSSSKFRFKSEFNVQLLRRHHTQNISLTYLELKLELTLSVSAQDQRYTQAVRVRTPVPRPPSLAHPKSSSQCAYDATPSGLV